MVDGFDLEQFIDDYQAWSAKTNSWSEKHKELMGK
jgi:hypothetical protein